MIKGTPVSPGIASGTAYVLACAKMTAAPRRTIEAADVDGELARFEASLGHAEHELLALMATVTDKIGASEAEIFAAQALLLSDPAFRNQVSALVRDKRVNVEAALAEVIEKFTRAFDEIPDAYLRERAADVRDVGRRVLGLLIQDRTPESLDIPAEAIVVAEELLPSVTARLEVGRARAFVTERGGKFSHTSILARSLGTPAVVGVADASTRIKTGDALIVDGFTGVVFIDPGDSVRREYARLESEIRTHKQALRHLIDLPAVTRDGTEIALLANVSKFADTEAALLYNAAGIGLYRTEFGYSVRGTFPSEDEQYEFLARAAERFHPRKVVFRLLDIGGDKELSYLPLPAARNPSLAQRGIRLLLDHPRILKLQLRAFLRISAQHPVSILMPVVGGLEEVRATRAHLREAQRELSAEGKAFNPDTPLGAMIEVPGAALIARALAREVDFFSLGTNDLVQYVLAADRENETVARYYQPLHPGVLRLIDLVVGAATASGRPLTICGDMAGDPFYTPLLLGLGLRELSVAPGEMLEVKNRIRDADLGAARELARAALTLGSAAEIEELLGGRDTGPRAALAAG
ncbi:MAG TPA: phosphoenolpyruvate--protein phosphotransferase [Polyangia bacterium]|nr:phosphoenolpyruvate--protein phosphotransferase [Polyangia bacterium]